MLPFDRENRDRHLEPARDIAAEQFRRLTARGWPTWAAKFGAGLVTGWVGNKRVRAAASLRKTDKYLPSNERDEPPL